jgi:ATP-dependent HslUV protease ATP-binding subunit HslU
VEASRFTEVGYVGRDVESIVRDLVELAIGMVRDEERERVRVRAAKNAEERLLDLLMGGRPAYETAAPGADSPTEPREKMRDLLRDGLLDERQLELEVADTRGPQLEVFTPQGVEELGLNLKDMFGGMFGGKKRKRKVPVKEAKELLEGEETEVLLDQDAVVQLGLERAQQDGIVFLDEIDKIAIKERGHGPDVSREGVQRDLLPIVEGATVHTKYGFVRTDHVLFIAAGAFHFAKPSDLIPELQGRFPIRVELSSLTRDDFVRILNEPENSLPKQYKALLGADGLDVSFTADGVERIAQVAFEANERMENIGARRLTTVMERVLDDVSFDAPERKGKDKEISVDAEYVSSRVDEILASEDLSRYVL